MESTCIIGIGASTPLGGSAASNAAAYRTAISGIAAHPVYLDSRGEFVYVSRDRRLPPTLQWGLRITALAVEAAREAVQVLTGLVGPSGADVDVVVAMPEPRPGVDVAVADTLAREIAAAIEPQARVSTVRFDWRGHASGLLGMSDAVHSIADGVAELMLLVGVDSYLCPETLEWLDANKQLKREGRRSGFPPGEGAAAVLLARRYDALRWGTPVLAEIVSGGVAREPHHIRSEDICIGEGLTAALRQALQPLGDSGAKVTDGYCDLNGERYRSEELMFSIVRVSPLFENAAAYATPADCFGDVGAASGVLFATLAIMAARRGCANGTLALVWAGSENGDRAAVLLRLSVMQGMFR